MKKVALCFLVLTIFMAGCASPPEVETPQEEGSNQESDSDSRPFLQASSTYFEEISWEENDNAYVVQGTVQVKNDKNGIVTWVDADEETALRVTGTMERNSGEIQLAYTAPDGTETPIAENEDGTIDSAIPISEGTGTIQFTGETAVCDFSLHFELTDGVKISSERKP